MAIKLMPGEIMKVLAIDDKQEDLDTIKEILELSGFEVTALKNGSEALGLLPDKFDAVLTDILMPGASGYELIKDVRKKTEGKMPVLFVTIVPKNEAFVEWADGFVQKPFSPKELVEQVNNAISKYKKQETMH